LQRTGHKLAIAWATAAVLVKRVQGGETADLLILTGQSLDTLVKEGKASAGAGAAFASSGIAVVVKKGAAQPDISTAEAFKRTLLAAPSIAYSNPEFGGVSDVYLAKLLERMGIADRLKADAANALIKFLHGPEAMAVFKARGLKPASG